MSIVLFLLVLFVLVLVHEWGHFIVAKKTGMRVDEFAIGFPPKLFRIKKGETEYSFNLLPIGGFVKIFGENAEAIETDEDRRDEGRAFYARPKWAQALVLIAGISMNIIFAWLLFSTTLLIGVPQAVDEATASDTAELVVVGTLKDAPADGVLPVGSTITAATVGGETLTNLTPTTFSGFISSHGGEAITISYSHNDAQGEATLTPKTGVVSDNPDKAVVGATLSLVELKREPLHLALYDGLKMTGNGLVAITIGLYDLLRDALLGQADFSSVAGPVGIVGLVGDAASFGLTSLLVFTAIISLNLAVINLLQFPALDGGRLLFVAIEAITGKQVPSKVTGWTNLVGFVLLMILMVAVTYNDILRLL